MTIMITDIKRAFFYAPVTRPIFIDIPLEDRGPGDDNMVAELKMALYATRDAAVNWFKTYSEHLISLGFEEGRTNPCIFIHRVRGLQTLVHGDDYATIGEQRVREKARARSIIR